MRERDVYAIMGRRGRKKVISKTHCYGRARNGIGGREGSGSGSEVGAAGGGIDGFHSIGAISFVSFERI